MSLGFLGHNPFQFKTNIKKFKYIIKFIRSHIICYNLIFSGNLEEELIYGVGWEEVMKDSYHENQNGWEGIGFSDVKERIENKVADLRKKEKCIKCCDKFRKYDVNFIIFSTH